MTSWTEILKANKGLYARDSFSELWGLKLKAARAEFPDYTITGTLPLSFNARLAGALKNYRLYGDSDGVGEETENLWNDSTTIEQGSFNADGSPALTDTRVRSDYAGVLQSGTYTIKSEGLTSIVVYVYDDNKDFLESQSVTSWQNVPFTFTVSQPVYIRLGFRRDNVTVVYPNDVYNIMLVEGSTAPTSFIPFGYKIPILCQSEIVTENLFDKNATDTNNGYVDGYHLKIDGTTSSNSSWAISEYMPITGGLDYTFNYGSLSSSPAICYYDSDKHFISGVPYGGQLPKTVSVPQNISYIRFSFMKSYVDDIMFVQANSLPDHYIPHFYQSNYDLFVGGTKLYEDEYLDFSEQKIYRTIILTTHDNKGFITSDNKRFCVRRSNNG